jgi:hypothetical protein
VQVADDPVFCDREVLGHATLFSATGRARVKG